MERFLALPEKRQNVIVDAAMSLFGAVGYKKGSVADIARAAGISKAMVFYYFGSKKALYLYLNEFSGNVLKNEIYGRLDPSVTDFFEIIKLSSEIKLSALKKYPAILSFLTSMYFETDKEVAEDIKRVIAEGEAYSMSFVFDKIETHKFKEDVDPELVLRILTNYTEGYLYKAGQATDFDAMMEDFNRCLELMRRHFYKAEYVL